MKLIFLSPLTCLLVLSCSGNKSIDEEKFLLVYTDLIIMQDTSGTSGHDSLKVAVFKRHNISEEDYKKTIAYYNDEPGRWEEFFNKAIAHVEAVRYKEASKK